MIRLSVNINKIATLRNARGGNTPDLLKAAEDIQRFGADGITVHPRPDERHIRYEDLPGLKKITWKELNIEGNPREKKFVKLVEEICPDQVTLVPDERGQLTSNHGWDTIANGFHLKEITQHFKSFGIRVSVFVDPVAEIIEAAAKAEVDRVELYTESYATNFHRNKTESVASFKMAAEKAIEYGLGINAGHDLSLENLGFFASNVMGLLEVSIGHALISDALYYGLENTIGLYKTRLQNGFRE